MNKTLMLFLVLLICALWLQAQPAYQGSGAGQTADSTPGPNALEGCLQSSDGEYTVTDKNGVIHHLSDGGKVKHYVGHEVQLTPRRLSEPSTRPWQAAHRAR